MSHILIIDDDIHINEMLEEVLIQEGFRFPMPIPGQRHYCFWQTKSRI